MLQGFRARALKADALALDRNGAAQLLVEELFAVTKAIYFGAERVDNVLDRLGVMEAVFNSPLLGVWLSIRRHAVRVVRSLHACDCAHTSVAREIDDAGHVLRSRDRAMWRVMSLVSTRGRLIIVGRVALVGRKIATAADTFPRGCRRAIRRAQLVIRSYCPFHFNAVVVFEVRAPKARMHGPC
jgi:hypothetical protein